MAIILERRRVSSWLLNLLLLAAKRPPPLSEPATETLRAFCEKEADRDVGRRLVLKRAHRHIRYPGSDRNVQEASARIAEPEVVLARSRGEAPSMIVTGRCPARALGPATGLQSTRREELVSADETGSLVMGSGRRQQRQHLCVISTKPDLYPAPLLAARSPLSDTGLFPAARAPDGADRCGADTQEDQWHARAARTHPCMHTHPTLSAAHAGRPLADTRSQDRPTGQQPRWRRKALGHDVSSKAGTSLRGTGTRRELQKMWRARTRCGLLVPEGPLSLVPPKTLQDMAIYEKS